MKLFALVFSCLITLSFEGIAQDFDLSLLNKPKVELPSKKDGASKNTLHKLDFGSGGTYLGQVKDGFPMGLGELKTKDYIYKGTFKNGMFHGDGTLLFKNGDSTTGYFENNNFMEGKIIKLGIASFEGRFELPKLEKNITKLLQQNTYQKKKYYTLTGYGTLRLENPSASFIGEFKDGKPTGDGKLTLSNGDVLSGNWNGFDIKDKGIIQYPDGWRYSGSVRNLLPDGYGRKERGQESVVGIFEDGILDSGDIYEYFSGKLGMVRVKNKGRHGQIKLTDGSIEGYFLYGDRVSNSEYQDELTRIKLEQAKVEMAKERRQLLAKQRKAKAERKKAIARAEKARKRRIREEQESAMMRGLFAVAGAAIVTSQSDMDSSLKTQIMNSAFQDAYLNTGGTNLAQLQSNVDATTKARLSYERKYYAEVAQLNKDLKKLKSKKYSRPSSVSYPKTNTRTVQVASNNSVASNVKGKSNTTIYIGTPNYQLSNNNKTTNQTSYSSENNGSATRQQTSAQVAVDKCYRERKTDNGHCRVEKVAICHKVVRNNTDWWSCAGRTQFAATPEKGHAGLKENLRYAGCETPRKELSMQGNYIAYYCGIPENLTGVSVSSIEKFMKTTLSERFLQNRKVYACNKNYDHKSCKSI